jgi:hypothetical protein
MSDKIEKNHFNMPLFNRIRMLKWKKKELVFLIFLKRFLITGSSDVNYILWLKYYWSPFVVLWQAVIPELLDLLDIAGAVVTIAAMGCQSKIVEKIIEKEAEYLIGLKGNQGTLIMRFGYSLKPDHKELFFIKMKNMTKDMVD